MKRILRFLTDEDGPTAVEYAVLLALLVGMMVLAVTRFGDATKDLSDHTVNALNNKLNN